MLAQSEMELPFPLELGKTEGLEEEDELSHVTSRGIVTIVTVVTIVTIVTAT